MRAFRLAVGVSELALFYLCFLPLWCRISARVVELLAMAHRIRARQRYVSTEAKANPCKSNLARVFSFPGGSRCCNVLQFFVFLFFWRSLYAGDFRVSRYFGVAMPKQYRLDDAERAQLTPEFLASVVFRLRRLSVPTESAFFMHLIARSYAAGDDVWLFIPAEKLYPVRRKLMEIGIDISVPVDADVPLVAAKPRRSRKRKPKEA